MVPNYSFFESFPAVWRMPLRRDLSLSTEKAKNDSMSKITTKLILKLMMSTVLGLFVLSGCANQPAEVSHGAAGHAHHAHGDDHGHNDKKAHAHGEKAHACAACKTGKEGGTAWCEGCKVGYVDGKVVKCQTCYKGKTGESVWCAKCNKGFVNKEGVKCESCFKAKTGGEPCTKCAPSK